MKLKDSRSIPLYRFSLFLIQAEWDGTHCQLTLEDQTVTIDVVGNNVIGFKVKVDKEKQAGRIIFRVPDWELKGEILSDRKLVLHYKGELWKEYEGNDLER